MSEVDEEQPPVHAPLECNDLVYRIARRRSDLDPDTNKLSPVVFIRDRSRDTMGLSVVIADACMPQEAAEPGRYANKPYGVGTLHVGHVRAMALDVEPDRIDHANITGVPFPEDDPPESERLSRLLARHARTAWHR